MGASIQHVDETERATAMGIHQALYGIGMFTGPWMSGMLADYCSISMTLGITAGLTLLLGILGTRQFIQNPPKR
jgi:DHA1 family multidrug resistance protein-like MFS transporter